MHLKMKITNIKSIQSFEFDFPLIQGLYALTGENGSGKSTIISCIATSFYNPMMYSYFGAPISGSKISFEYNGKTRYVGSNRGRWFNANGNLGIAGFFEGSLIFGNRFKDVDFSTLKTLSKVRKEDLLHATDFVKENLGSILHDDKSYYNQLFLLNEVETKKNNLLKQPYYYKTSNGLINQLNMSTGENLLISVLHSLEMRISRGNYSSIPTLILLDEIELALHSSALRRLVFFLKELSSKHNFSVLFSTHSIELIRSINPQNIFYIQNYADNSIEIINPCYPVYATRNLESSNYGHDYIIMVEDNLAKSVVDKILCTRRLLGNKRILVIAVGGWNQVLRFAYDTIRSNLTLSTTKILIILDRDIKEQVSGFLKKEGIGFSNPPHYLPIKSVEKYLLENLVHNVDRILFGRLNDYIFQNKSLHDIVSKYKSNVNNGAYADSEKIKNGKQFYEELKNELRQIRKNEDDISELIVTYLFENGNEQIEELTNFLEYTLAPNADLVLSQIE
jgi:ABC-type branched-subunit amino acid transport system ATPase component